MDSIFATEAQPDNFSDEPLMQISEAMDKFEGYAHPHGRRIAVIADAISEKFNFASHDRHALRQAALVHDLGEMVMNREYIKANRLLRDEERIDMQRHTVIGEQEAAKRGLNRAVQLLVRWHHEWWNGAGYPDALEHEQIPLAARILRVADTFAALTDSRPYSVAISASEAKRYLIEWSGIEFDPKIVKTFLSLEGLPELQSFAAGENARLEERKDIEVFSTEKPVFSG
jgi:HD-GYP domain-containing protein (c-di-GMP phosphodiesterase class II)